MLQTHQSQCLVQDERFKGLECEVFQHPKPSSMALSTLVVIEMLNAMNRLAEHGVVSACRKFLLPPTCTDRLAVVHSTEDAS